MNGGKKYAFSWRNCNTTHFSNNNNTDICVRP